jgi:MoaA/NifB/PqqE/SkfB family radical SAM enzyme
MKPELSPDIADRLLHECEALGINFVTILGGDPLMYPHLITLLERHSSIFFKCTATAPS